MTERHANFPAPSVARIVIMFEPTRSGMGGVVQEVVPFAVPDPPLELVQVTDAMPAPPDAVPENTIVAAEVNAFVVDGKMIVSAGGAVLFAGCVDGGLEGGGGGGDGGGGGV